MCMADALLSRWKRAQYLPNSTMISWALTKKSHRYDQGNNNQRPSQATDTRKEPTESIFAENVVIPWRLALVSMSASWTKQPTTEWRSITDTFRRRAAEKVQKTKIRLPFLSYSFKFQHPLQLSSPFRVFLMITPVFSAAHVSQWENISDDDRRPRRKRTRLSDGEDQTETDVDVDPDVDYEYSPAPRRVKPLPAHVHGNRQRSDGELPPMQTSTKESSHGQYIPTGRSLRRGHSLRIQTFL
ncbi:hypothetical protein EV702DRAFT_646963 [Suillus placidus]|uniref:Uncharacterized protein n=1 Tax=Suillus placidus TaxID=48579 RepID=A0A9P7A3P3_9AGAM|nr:hypothetical protein EV702DRAFT_646963 [Suillus placidus]